MQVLKELEWEQAVRAIMPPQQQENQTDGVYFPSQPFQYNSASQPPLPSMSMNSSSDEGSGSISDSGNSSSISETNSSSALQLMPWDEPWLQEVMDVMAEVTNNHTTMGSGFQVCIN